MDKLLDVFADALDGIWMYIIPMLLIIALTVLFSRHVDSKYRARKTENQEKKNINEKASTLEGGM